VDQLSTKHKQAISHVCVIRRKNNPSAISRTHYALNKQEVTKILQQFNLYVSRFLF